LQGFVHLDFHIVTIFQKKVSIFSNFILPGFQQTKIVTEALKYTYTSAAPVPHISAKLARCKI